VFPLSLGACTLASWVVHVMVDVVVVMSRLAINTHGVFASVADGGSKSKERTNKNSL
jgi:hypothetical protein